MPAVKISEMSPEELRIWRSEIGRRGGKKRAQSFTRAHQKAARRAVSSASCAANGAKGAQATTARYGYESLFLNCRRKRLLNPSMLELQMIGLLSRFELKPQRDYEREHRLGSTFYTVDFYLPRSRKAIEVHGKVHKLFDAEVRAKHDAIKAQWLADNGIGLLVVQYTEFEDLVALHAKLSSFLSGEQSKPEATW